MSKKAVTFTEEDPQVFEYEQTELPPELKKEREQSQARKDWFMAMMAISLGLRTPQQLLDEVSFEGVAKYIADGKCSNIITMAGAGISTSAGILDYRSAGTGLMDQMKAKYPSVKDVSDLFNIQFFLRNPHPFFERSKRFFEISLKPTPCHYFVRLLHEKGLLLRHYTQNIDTLERLAGLPADKVVEAHGSYYTSHCMLCDAQYSFPWMEERVLKEELPTCEEEGCTGVIKPDIVMFGESLPETFGEYAEEDTLKCDLLIILGTALAVQPFASLTSKVKTSTPRLYINLDRGKTAKKHPMTDIMFGGSFDFDCEDNVRDVFKQAKCDEACYAIADQVGWGEELRSLVKSEHARIDEEDRIKGKTTAPPLTDFNDTAIASDSHVTDTPHKTSSSAKTSEVPSNKAGKPSSKTLTTKETAKAKDRSPRPSNKSSSLNTKQGDHKGAVNNRDSPGHSSHKHGTSGGTVTSGKPGTASQSGGAAPRSTPGASASSGTAGASGATAGRTGATAGAKNPPAAAGEGKQPVTFGNKTKPIAGK